MADIENTEITEIWVNRGDFRDARVVRSDVGALAEGEVLVTIDKYGLTSNNVSYAVSGDQIGYWDYFPTGEDGWGKVTVWGMADVVASNSSDIAVGERLYGFFPMSSHLILSPSAVTPSNFFDAAPHRQALPPLYNQYMRTDAEPDFLRQMEVERCLYFPLFMTSYVITDFLQDHDFFGAEQILIGSVSSKTGFGLARFLQDNKAFAGQIIGLTSPGNQAFVQDLGVCDAVVTYDQVDTISADKPTVYIDMSGDGPLRKRLHDRIGDNMKSSQVVGVTHWEEKRSLGEMPGARPEFFFAPGHIGKRNKELGKGVLVKEAYTASAALARSLKGTIKVDHIKGPEAGIAIWKDMLDNKIPGSRGIMVSLA